MEQMNILWQYQELDLLVDQYETEKKDSDLRHRLVKIKNYLVNQDKYLVKLDDEAERKNQGYTKILQDFESVLDTVTVKKNKLESGEPNTIEELEQMVKEGLMLQDKLDRKEEELKRLVKELDSLQKKLDDIRVKVTKAKKDYVKLKKEYDNEVLKIKQEQDKIKEKRDQIAANIDKTLMAKYKNLKINRTPVIATLENDQCSGCYMSLASLVVQNVKDGKRIMECENCGRFLYYRS